MVRDVAGLPDPLEQAALVHRLLHAHPAAAASICAALPSSGPAREECSRTQLRPHLSESAAVTVPKSRPAVGPASWLPPALGRAPPWSGPIDSDTGECGGDPRCLEAWGEEQAAAGKIERAGAACAAAWPVDSAAGQECVFRAAEVVARVRRGASVEEPLAACAGAGSFERHCVQHVLVEGTPQATAASDPDPEVVASSVAIIEGVAEWVGGAEGRICADLMWATWTLDATRGERQPSGDLVPLLPAAALPQLRAAEAISLLTARAASLPDAEALARLLEEGLATPSTAHRRLVAKGPPASRLLGNRLRPGWMQDGAGEGARPATWVLGAGRRTLGERAEDDIRIAVLEAGWRLDTPPPAAWFAALDAPGQAEAVRWTAARLAGARASLSQGG